MLILPAVTGWQTFGVGVVLAIWVIIFGLCDYWFEGVVLASDSIGKVRRNGPRVEASNLYAFRYRTLHIEGSGKGTRLHLACLEVRDDQFNRVHVQRYGFGYFGVNASLLADIKRFASQTKLHDSEELRRFLGSSASSV